MVDFVKFSILSNENDLLDHINNIISSYVYVYNLQYKQPSTIKATIYHATIIELKEIFNTLLSKDYEIEINIEI